MKFEVGDTLSLNVDAVNPQTPDKIEFPIGTLVIVDSIHEKTINLKFPNGLILAHKIGQVELIFSKYSKSNNDICLNRNIHGTGTPPKALFPYMPQEAQWFNNYEYDIKITLKLINRKKFICTDCYTELEGNDTTLFAGIMCPQCKTTKIPVAVESIIKE